jgi:hypothetical protein
MEIAKNKLLVLSTNQEEIESIIDKPKSQVLGTVNIPFLGSPALYVNRENMISWGNATCWAISSQRLHAHRNFQKLFRQGVAESGRFEQFGDLPLLSDPFQETA